MNVGAQIQAEISKHLLRRWWRFKKQHLVFSFRFMNDGAP